MLHAHGHTHTHRGPYCVARHPFSAEGPDELTIAPGEKIELLERVGSEWYKGRLGRREGLFPAHFVEIKVDLPEAVEGKSSLSSKTLSLAVHEVGGGAKGKAREGLAV